MMFYSIVYSMVIYCLYKHIIPGWDSQTNYLQEPKKLNHKK